jgi:spore coat protein CotH
VASFVANGKEVKVDGVAQVSGQTANNFNQPVKYVVEGEAGTQKEFTVEVHFFTGLPILYLATEQGAGITSKDDYLRGTMKLEAGSYAEYNGAIEIRGRGNTTWDMPKKPYRIKLREKASLLGMPADRDWVLLANYADKTLMRNAVAFELSRRFDLPFTPRHQFVEVFLNGAYQGNYLLTEQIEVEKHRVNITELKASDISDQVISGGYLLEIDVRLDEDVWFHTSKGIPVTVKSPEDITPEQIGYIKQFLEATEAALFSSSFTDPETGYNRYIDTENFINWYLVNELLKNNDAVFHSSVYLYKDRNKQLSLGPVWDFDIALGNINYNGNGDPLGWWIKSNNLWMKQLFEDPDFRKKVKARWQVLMQTQLPTLYAFINSTARQLKYSQKENFDKWDILDHYTWPNMVVMGDYENEVQYLKDWLSKRINWMDAEINKME